MYKGVDWITIFQNKGYGTELRYIPTTQYILVTSDYIHETWEICMLILKQMDIKKYIKILVS